jgi:hypothetical protein
MFSHLKAMKYQGYSKINIQMACKKKRVDLASNHKLSINNKQRLFSMNTKPQTFSLRSVGVIADETRTLSMPLLPAMRCELLLVLKSIVDCVMYTEKMLRVTVV